jgi:alpha-beta hydrolase superfamily lysophospholipase
MDLAVSETKLTGFVELAQRMAQTGLVSLRIDMRGCGRSGIPGVMHPWDWVEDLRQAVSFLQTLPTIALIESASSA